MRGLQEQQSVLPLEENLPGPWYSSGKPQSSSQQDRTQSRCGHGVGLPAGISVQNLEWPDATGELDTPGLNECCQRSKKEQGPFKNGCDGPI